MINLFYYFNISIMKKIFLLLGLLFIAQCAEAKIFRNYNYPPRYYNNNYPARYNGVYYNNPRRYYNNRYYNYPRNFYYNQQPVIYRQGVRRSMADETLVAGQFSGLENMERQIFNQTFEYDLAKNRIERLEQKVFGAMQNGTLEERFIVLKSAVKNYKAYNPEGYVPQSAYNQYRPPIFTGTAGSSWKSMLLGNFRNQFAGMPTGFTPAMDPAYMDYFEAERAMMGNGESVDYRTNHGYHRSNVNRGSGVGVTILD